MASALPQEDLFVIRDVLQEVAGALDAGGPAESAADLELRALQAMGPLGDPEAPDEAVALLADALEDRGDELAAGVLAALGALAPPPLDGFAAAARQRLAAAGIVSELAEGVGEVHAHACQSAALDDGDSEVLWAILRREGDPLTQAAVLIIDHLACGGVILDGVLTAPDDPETTAQRARFIATDTERTESLSRIGTIARVTEALEHMVDHEIELGHDSLAALILLERGLTGQTGRWPRPLLEPWPDPDAVPVEDEWPEAVDLLADPASPPKRVGRDRRGRRKAARAARRRNRR